MSKSTSPHVQQDITVFIVLATRYFALRESSRCRAPESKSARLPRWNGTPPSSEPIHLREKQNGGPPAVALDHVFSNVHIYIAWAVILGLALFGALRALLYEYHDLVSLGRRLKIWK